MNAYETVDKLINEDMISNITDYELNRLEDGAVVLAILKSKYNARYCQPYDERSCGSWAFDNPNYVPVPHLQLLYTFKERNEWFSYMMVNLTSYDKPYAKFAEEIIRLDISGNLYWERRTNEKAKKKFDTLVEKIATELEKTPIYIGPHRIWRVMTIDILMKPKKENKTTPKKED